MGGNRDGEQQSEIITSNFDQYMKRITFPILMTAAVLISCQDKQQAPPRVQRATLPVVEVPVRTVTGFSNYPVSIEGTVSSAVRAKVAGYITAVLVDEGQRVSRGQVLFRLETQALSQDAGAAKANVNAAQVEVNKLRPLVEKGIISPVQLETAEARLAQAVASYNSITASIDYATIKSPIDGYVGAINFRQGALVSPSDPTPLTIVSDIDNVYAFFSMNERDYLDFLQKTEGKNLTEKIKNSPPVELQLVNGQIYPEKGKIETVTGQVNRATGTVSFRATFPNPNRMLTHGNSGTIRVPKVYENVRLVPASATFEQQGIVYVYKVQGDTVAIANPIEVIDRVNGIVVVSSGVDAGEKIIAQGTGKIRDNAPVAPQPVPFDSIANAVKVVFK
jgi:membrane fusion protein (multidrug efflux system)